MSSSCPAPGGARHGAGLGYVVFAKSVPAKEAQNGQPKVNAKRQWPEKAVFSGHLQRTPRKTLAVPGASRGFNEDERSLPADPDTSDPPAIAVPEALALPVAGAGGVGHIGRRAVIVVALRRIARVVITRAVIVAGAVIVVLRGDRAADDGAADQPGRHARGNAALGMSGGGGRDDRNGQRGDGGKRRQRLSHGFTFPVEQMTAHHHPVGGKVPYPA